MTETTFGIHANSRIEVIIDGTHLYAVARNLGIDIDFARLRKILYTEYNCRRITYLIKTPHDENGVITTPSVARILDYLRFNGFTTIVGETKEWTDQSSGRRIVRQSVDVAIACLMMKATRHVDEIILFAGSDELAIAAETCMEGGARVTVVSSVKTTPVMIAQDLRAIADTFIDISDLKDQISRQGREPNFSVAERVTAQIDEAQTIEDRRDATSLRARVRLNPRT
jgi:uncharacterized LabA/DUF88 family protein